MIALFWMQTTMRGLVNVFVILVATAGVGGSDARAGTLFAAIGVGGLVGAAFGLGSGSGRAGTGRFAAGVCLWGLPVLVIGIWTEFSVALVALIVLGVGNAIQDVYGFSLVNRLVPDHLAGRAWGAYYAVQAATVALGSVAAPLLVSLVGLSWAMIVTGAALALAPVVLWPKLRAVEALAGGRSEHVALVREVALFAPLSMIAVERLARAAQEHLVEPGAVVVGQGEPADGFYVVVEGDFSVHRDGAPVRRLGRAASFGEIGLLDDVPRTASVVAESAGRLLRLDGEAFVAAVTGHRPTDDVARMTMGHYRDEDRVRGRPDDPARQRPDDPAKGT